MEVKITLPKNEFTNLKKYTQLYVKSEPQPVLDGL